MDKKLAKQLLILVNTHNDLLKLYAENRIHLIHEQMENSGNKPEDFYRMQGKIVELRRLLTLREEIIKEAEG